MAPLQHTIGKQQNACLKIHLKSHHGMAPIFTITCNYFEPHCSYFSTLGNFKQCKTKFWAELEPPCFFTRPFNSASYYYADCWSCMCAVFVLNMERGEGCSKKIASTKHGLYCHIFGGAHDL